MTRDLKHELAVPAFMQEATVWRVALGQPAKNERSGREDQALALGLAVCAYQFDGLRLTQLPLGDHQLRETAPENLTRPPQDWLAERFCALPDTILTATSPHNCSRNGRELEPTGSTRHPES